MINVAAVDSTELAFMLRATLHALNGTGRDGDASTCVADQGRLLSVEIAQQLSPRNIGAGERSIARDVSFFLYAPTTENLFGNQRHGVDMTWFAAGPNFLSGANHQDYHGDSWGDAEPLLRVAKKESRSKNKYIHLGQNRQGQHVQRVDRYVVSGIAHRTLVLKLSGHIGRMKASIYETAARLGHHGIPAWIMRQIPTPKNITDLTNLARIGNNEIEFGSSARGITQQSAKFQRACNIRAKKMAIALKGILSGYSADWKAGLRPRKRGHRAGS